MSIDPKGDFGVRKLDNLTLGTIGEGSLGLLYGPSGTGKSSLGYSFLFEGARNDENCLLITSEVPSVVRARMSGFEGFDPRWLKEGRLSVLMYREMMRLIGVDPWNMNQTDMILFFRLLMKAAADLKANRLVMDPVNPMIVQLAGLRRSDLVPNLKGEVQRRGIKTLMITDTFGDLEDELSGVFSPYMFDFVFRFDKQVEHSTSRNTFHIEKFRGAPHSRSEYVIEVSPEGIVLMPCITPLEVE